jgi:hypothetical protein
LPFLGYKCKTLSLTLNEEHRLGMFDNGAEENILTGGERESIDGLDKTACLGAS